MVNTSLLYSFVHVPVINMHFLGLYRYYTEEHSLLALLAAGAQYLQLHFSLASVKTEVNDKSNPQSTNGYGTEHDKNMKYVFLSLSFLSHTKFLQSSRSTGPFQASLLSVRSSSFDDTSRTINLCNYLLIKSSDQSVRSFLFMK
jgi:hypothetical protein